MDIRMKEVGLKLWMYKRYVDDVNVILSTPAPGRRFDGDQLVTNEEEDQEMKTDERAGYAIVSVGCQ